MQKMKGTRKWKNEYYGEEERIGSAIIP